jgi:hypothetical protein
MRARYGVVRAAGNDQNARLPFAWPALDAADALRKNPSHRNFKNIRPQVGSGEET